MPEKCARCGSDKVMENVHLHSDRDQASSVFDHRTRLVAYLHKNPDAWFRKGTVYSDLRARVCGSCGYTELYTTDFERLYEAYQQAQGS
jgi:predicted nucleic-acid-binding Zn-ribbon protein